MALSINVGEMLVNLSESYTPIFKMLTGGAYVMGFAFGMLAIYSLKEYGQARTMMSSNTSLKPAVIYMLVASVFLYMPSVVDILMQSTFGATTIPISYSETGSTDVVSADVQIAILRLVQLIGVIAFIRGWFILAQSAKQGTQSVVGRALTHIIGGILAINIIGTKNVIWATFGLS